MKAQTAHLDQLVDDRRGRVNHDGEFLRGGV
jgi:hypothetical protein